MPIVLSTKVNLLYFLYSTVQSCCLQYLIKQNCLLKTFLRTLDSGISLPVFPSRINLKLYDIFVTAKMIKKVVMNLDLSNACSPDCIPVVVLKNCELNSSISDWRSLLFQIVGRFYWWPLYLKMLGERSTAKNYHLLVFFLWLVLVNNRNVVHLRNVFFLISNVILGLLDQLHVFLQLYMIELLGLLTDLGLLQL